MVSERPFVIYTYPYSETSGGIIALYLLCERLNQVGQLAFIWPDNKLVYRKAHWYYLLKGFVRKLIGRPRENVYQSSSFTPKIARHADLRNAIAVYPEVVAGNPLGARNVVRWFLHRPGYHTGQVEYGSGEICFFYQDAFNDPLYNPDPTNRLTLTQMHPAYRQVRHGAREGTCYLLRKGRERAAGRNFDGQLCVDTLSHEKKADAFNRNRYLHSFDTYSMYSVFAAVCGCIPVIEPVPGISREEWFPNEVDRYGLAYGWDDVAWAERTRGLLIERLEADRREEDKMLSRFVSKTQAFFSGSR